MSYIVRTVYKSECLVGSQTLIFSRGGLQIRRNESAGTSPLKRGRRNEWIPIMRTNILIVRAVYKSECLVGSQTLIFSRGGLQIRRNKAAETRPPKRVRRNESAGTSPPERGHRNEWIPIMRTNILIGCAVYKSECLVGSQTLIFSRGGLQIRRNESAGTSPPERGETWPPKTAGRGDGEISRAIAC